MGFFYSVPEICSLFASGAAFFISWYNIQRIIRIYVMIIIIIKKLR